jgi:probable DNA repair protein
MYDWLDDALDGSGAVVTASRRLARTLNYEFARRRLADHQLAWPTPAIIAWGDWLAQLLTTVADQATMPVRLSGHQERLLWEQCLRHEIDEPLLSAGALVKQSREAWSRLAEFGVTLQEVRDAARGTDQRLFSRVAARYRAVLEREGWVDEAGLAGLVTNYTAAGQVALPAELLFVGFDRLVPVVQAFIDGAKAQGTAARIAAIGGPAGQGTLFEFENPDCELRAAGAWARDALLKEPGQRIAIIASNLDQNADRIARLVKEGLIPGWQVAPSRHARVLNVSHGRKLADIPACAIALLILKWLHAELNSRELSVLLRSRCIGTSVEPGRVRLEIRSRQRPDQDWTPEMFLRAFSSGRDLAINGGDWRERLGQFAALKSKLPRRAKPSVWIELMDKALRLWNWPGDETLSSDDFQLLNRWRELLNDFARLDLVSPAISASVAVSRLVSMAVETIYQPDQSGATVELLAPLEAAGMEFDSVWVAGATSAAWPSARRPLALVNRQLQQEHQMPDADPADGLAFSQTILRRLAGSSPHWVCSYAATENDTEQAASDMLSEFALCAEKPPSDPGWYAKSLTGGEHTVIEATDPVPAVGSGETISGGAMSIQWQLDEPFQAFACARLGVRRLPAFVRGLSAGYRGNLIHEALHHLYVELAEGSNLSDWDDQAVCDRVSAAARKAFGLHFRTASTVLKALLRLEQDRASQLMHAVVRFDKESRDPFKVSGVEENLRATIAGLELRLRVDRLDRLNTGDLVILDYKTGAWRRLLDRDGMPKEIQLIVYACALQQPIADIGFYNVDSRAVGIDGAGRSLSPNLDWDVELDRWRERVNQAARSLLQGDVRLTSRHRLQAARPLSLLSRVAELRNEN